MAVKYQSINPSEVYDSLHWRCAYTAGTWYDFLKNNNIEVISHLDPCTMESNQNKFVICNDPASGQSLKVPEELAHNLRNNPYFDNEVTDSDFPKIDNLLQNLSKEDKDIVEQVKEFGDGSGNTNMEVSITVGLNCDWNGDILDPTVTVSEIDDNDTLKHGVDWDNVKEIQNKAKYEVLNKVAHYKSILFKIAASLKINSDDVHNHIMGWS